MEIQVRGHVCFVKDMEFQVRGHVKFIKNMDFQVFRRQKKRYKMKLIKNDISVIVRILIY